MHISTELDQIAAHPESLNRLSVPELDALWRRCCPKRSPSPHRALLIRDLARVAQSGGRLLPRETRALIRAAMKEASVNRCSGATPAKMPKKPISGVPRRLPEGAKLIRDWGGQSHEVTVLGDGLWFHYQGQNYRSLTRVARTITGAHWSGPRFFGLKQAEGARV